MTYKQKQQLHKPVVIHLSGDLSTVLGALAVGQVEHVFPVHEFLIASPWKMLALVRQHRRSSVIVVTKDLRYQRFRTIWKLYAALGGMWNWMFADEHGSVDRFQWWKLLAVEVPLLMVEIIITLGVLVVGDCRLRRYRRYCRC